METRTLLATLAGGITYFLGGWALYGTLFADFFKTNAGTASGIEKMPPELWAIGIGSLVFSLLLTLLFIRWAGIVTFRGGAIGGAWVSFLVSLSVDFMLFGSSNMSNITATIVDPILGALMGAITGGVIGWVLGYKGKK